jgi:hypothetical protein
MRVSLSLMFALVMLTSGCGRMAAERALTETARDNHNCPYEQINISKKTDGEWTYEVDVCGRRRKYSDTEDNGKWEFKEVKRDRKRGPADEAFEDMEEEGSGSEEASSDDAASDDVDDFDL